MIKKLLLLVLLLFLVSCSIKYVPVKTENIKIQEDYAIWESEQLMFAAENKYWVEEPENITDYFTTFYIIVKNKTDQKIKINASDIGLLDEKGNQYDVVDTKYIEDLLLPREFEFDQITDISEDQPQLLEDWRDAKKNLILESFSFGVILPNAQKSGFIFFPKIHSKNNYCSIIFKDAVLKFIRSDVKQ
ncbi:MAG TPA: hypothetical protein DHM37_04800 [Candidatus Cloacimonas sp.]|nr:hypothetical protein [Candidatus Cloacimonas sp.]